MHSGGRFFRTSMHRGQIEWYCMYVRYTYEQDQLLRASLTHPRLSRAAYFRLTVAFTSPAMRIVLILLTLSLFSSRALYHASSMQPTIA